MDLARLYDHVEAQGSLPPVEQWHPPFCGDIDMHIAHDGTWIYNGTPILRPAMVRLFAGILRREADDYFLVTPVEKVRITVEDVPFIAVELTPADGNLVFRTNVDDRITADAGHALRFENDDKGFKPYIHVRSGLDARLSRTLAQDLVNTGEIRNHDGEPWLGVCSGGLFFPVIRAGQL